MSVVYYNVGEGQSIFKAICRNPKNFDRYFILADFCEENKDLVAAECWRLLGTTEKYPTLQQPLAPLTAYKYWWFPPGIAIVSCTLPKVWMRNMSHDRRIATQRYISRSDGFNNAIVGWRNMNEMERKISTMICMRHKKYGS